MNSRRKFLAGLGAVGIIGTVGALTSIPASWFLADKQQWLVSAGSDKAGNYFVAAFNLAGQLINKIPLPARGHDVIGIDSKPGHALVFARRPGNYVLEIDFIRGEVVSEIKVGRGQRFYGHGVLINNDQVLVTTENDYEQGKGLVVLRDRLTQQVIEQYDSGGIGPHQLAVMPNSNDKQIVIANGGILTHPDQGRKKLNLDTMRSNLAYLSLDNGYVADTFELENKHLSIRHLDVSSTGKVVAGIQYQGASTDEVPLAISHHGEEALTIMSASNNTWRNMKHYTASVCVDSTNKRVVITCPKANLITFWQLDSNEFINSQKLKDGAGVALMDNAFIASTGRGRIISQDNLSQLTPLKPYTVEADFKSLRWDNHLAVINA